MIFPKEESLGEKKADFDGYHCQLLGRTEVGTFCGVVVL